MLSVDFLSADSMVASTTINMANDILSNASDSISLYGLLKL